MRYALVLLLSAASLLAQDPTSAREWLNRGVSYYKAGQYPDAIGAFTKAVEMDPSFTTGYLYLGTAYMNMYVPGARSEENDALAAKAHALFQKTLGLDANNKVALASEASLYLNQKQWDTAKQSYEKLIAVDPNNADAYYSLGFIAWSQWYPAYGQARKEAGMKQQDPGPIADVAIRAGLKAKWDQTIQDGLMALDKALTINPNYDDAMAYENLLVRERADLRDTVPEYQSDISVADQWVQKALATKKMKAEAGVQPAAQRIVAGSSQSANLLSHIDPVYPPLARQARIEGVVQLALTIGTDGRPKDLQVVRGHPLLIMAAIEAVRQWVYAPTLLNGAPVEIKTTVDVPFTLSQ